MAVNLGSGVFFRLLKISGGEMNQAGRAVRSASVCRRHTALAAWGVKVCRLLEWQILVMLVGVADML
jgi:hypothetical protein